MRVLMEEENQWVNGGNHSGTALLTDLGKLGVSTVLGLGVGMVASRGLNGPKHYHSTSITVPVVAASVASAMLSHFINDGIRYIKTNYGASTKDPE